MRKLSSLLNDLETKGIENDLHAIERKRKYLNITRDTGEFLAVMVKSIFAKQILEIGTSNGYSTIWLASALQSGGKVTTIESNPEKIEEARTNFAKANISSLVTILEGDAVRLIDDIADKFDMVFLDAERSIYPKIVNGIVRLTRSGGIIIFDNAISHRIELEPIVAYFSQRELYTTCLVPVGKGEFVIHKGSSKSCNDR